MRHTDDIRRYPPICDWQIWSEIQYLDSPTDYREYLPDPTYIYRHYPENLVRLSEARRALKRRKRKYPTLIMIALPFIGAGFLLWWGILDKL